MRSGSGARRAEDGKVVSRLDGLIIAACSSSTPLERLEEQSELLVLIDRSFPESGVNFVGVDDVIVRASGNRHLARARFPQPAQRAIERSPD